VCVCVCVCVCIHVCGCNPIYTYTYYTYLSSRRQGLRTYLSSRRQGLVHKTLLLAPYSKVRSEVLHDLEIDRTEFVGAIYQGSTAGSNDRAVTAPAKESPSLIFLCYRQSSWMPSPHLEKSARRKWRRHCKHALFFFNLFFRDIIRGYPTWKKASARLRPCEHAPFFFNFFYFHLENSERETEALRTRPWNSTALPPGATNSHASTATPLFFFY